MNNDAYKLKYMKYKSKYLELKEMNAGMNPVEVNMIEKIRILKDEMKVLNDLLIKIKRGENTNIFEIIKEHSRISKYVYDIFRSWFLESEEGREWLLKKREELKLIKNEESYNLKINLLTDNITLEQIKVENYENGDIISTPINRGYDEIENTININIHTHPYNQGLHYLNEDFKYHNKGRLNYPKLLSMPSYIDISTSLKADLRYYTFNGIISESDISFYSIHDELIMEMFQNPIKQDLLFDVLMHNANEIKSDLVKDIYQKLTTEELISQLKKRYLNLLDPEHDARIKAIKFEIIKLD